MEFRRNSQDEHSVLIMSTINMIFCSRQTNLFCRQRTALGDPGDAILWREDDGGLADEVNVIVNGEYQRSDLWPSCNWLYNVAVGGRRETRGSVAFLLPIGALVVLLVLDVRFPLLFWNLRHGLEVYGGEPTDWYYAMQRVSRIASIIGVFVLAAMSFAVH